MIRRPYLAMFLILPAVTVVIFAMLIPLGYGLVMSLFDYKIGSETSATFVFLKNYVRFLQDPLAIKSLGITLAFTGLALSFELMPGVGMAVLLRSIPERWARILGAFYAMPLLVSPIIVGLIWRYMYDPTFGVVYYVLSWFGLDSVFGGLEKPGWALFSIAIADVWETTPFVLIVASAGLANIPEGTVRSGADRWRERLALADANHASSSEEGPFGGDHHPRYGRLPSLRHHLCADRRRSGQLHLVA